MLSSFSFSFSSSRSRSRRRRRRRRQSLLLLLLLLSLLPAFVAVARVRSFAFASQGCLDKKHLFSSLDCTCSGQVKQQNDLRVPALSVLFILIALRTPPLLLIAVTR